MVLGLGSRSKKDRVSASAASQLVDLDLQLHEIKPWQGHHRSSKAPVSVILRWSRGEKPIGSSRSISPTVGSGTEGGKIVLGEAFRISIAPNRDVLKRAKKTSPDLDRPLVFSLLETSSLKGQPLAQAALDLAAFASLPDSKTIAIPLTVSKKISSKGSISYLHLTVGHHQDDIHSGAAAAEGRFPVSASAANSASSRTSDASSVPPLDEDSQQALVAALLSEEEEEGDDKDGEIAPFTDDEDDDHGDDPVPQGSHPQGNVNVAAVASVFQSVVEKPTNKPIQQIVEKQPEKADDRISRHVLSSPPKASPVKAAAIVAATAYATKHSFLTRGTNSFMDESYDLYSDPDSAGEDDFSTHVSLGARSPNLLAKGPQIGGRSFHTSLSRSGAESVSSAAVDKSTKAAGEKAVVETKGTAKTISLAGKDLHEGANTNDVVGNKAVISDRYSKLSSEHFSVYGTHAGNSSSMNLAKTPSNSAMSNLVDRKTPVAGMVGALGEKVGLPSIGSITTTANSSTLNSTKESNSKSLEASLEPKTVLERDIDNEKMLDKVSNSNPSVEIGEVQVGSMVESGIVAEDKYQRKTLVEMKAKVAVKSSLKEKDAVEPPKMRASKSPDQMKGRISESLDQNLTSSKSANQEGEARAFKSPERDSENVDKKATEEAKPKVALAEAKAAVAETRVQNLEVEVEKLKGELRDVAAVEAALYSTTAEHGSSSLKLHAPARRLARMYVYACNHWSEERRASCARNTVAGLILVARACGNDVPRLTFWWSNAAVLREIISTAFSVLPASPKVDTASHTDLQAERADFASFPKETKLRQQQQVASPVLNFEDWRQPSTFTSSLERLEGWIYTKVVESIWWQVLTPQMQQPMDDTSSEIDLSDVDVNLDVVKNEKKSFGLELEDARQGSISVEIWKKAFLDAYERLCPVRRLGVECGCLPMLNKMVLETCIVRLDVAMFNAILRDDEAPTDPISDPISDTRVLPIPTSSLSFGLGAQLKNAVTTLSSWLSNLISKDGDSVMNGSIPEEDEKSLVMFPLLKAMGGLLMLPKAMLIEKSFRIEVCPTLSLPFIERILSRFKPDELSTEPVTPELLEAINSEVAAESQLQGDMDDSVTTLRSAFAPSVIYSRPQSSMVRHWIGDTASSNSRFGRSNSSVLRKGHTSDDEIDELESPISWLLENTIGLTAGSLNRPSMGQKDDSHANGKATNTFKETGTNCRFQLLREVWNSG